MSQRDNATLVQRAKNGDPEAFSEIYEQTYSKIFSYVYYRVSDSATAEDLTSEVYVRLVKKIDTFQERGRPLLAWLYTIAGNLVRDHHRRANRVKFLPIEDREMVSDDDPAATTELSLSSDLLADAIQHLTDEQAQVIILKFVEGKNNKEIAHLMGKKEGSVKSLQHRALRSLRRILERIEEERRRKGMDGTDGSV